MSSFASRWWDDPAAAAAAAWHSAAARNALLPLLRWWCNAHAQTGSLAVHCALPGDPRPRVCGQQSGGVWGVRVWGGAWVFLPACQQAAAGLSSSSSRLHFVGQGSDWMLGSRSLGVPASGRLGWAVVRGSAGPPLTLLVRPGGGSWDTAAAAAGVAQAQQLCAGCVCVV